MRLEARIARHIERIRTGKGLRVVSDSLGDPRIGTLERYESLVFSSDVPSFERMMGGPGDRHGYDDRLKAEFGDDLGYFMGVALFEAAGNVAKHANGWDPRKLVVIERIDDDLGRSHFVISGQDTQGRSTSRTPKEKMAAGAPRDLLSPNGRGQLYMSAMSHFKAYRVNGARLYLSWDPKLPLLSYSPP